MHTGIGNTHDGPVLVGHKKTNSLTLLFDCIPNATQTFDPPTVGERIWAVRSTDVSQCVTYCGTVDDVLAPGSNVHRSEEKNITPLSLRRPA